MDGGGDVVDRLGSVIRAADPAEHRPGQDRRRCRLVPQRV